VIGARYYRASGVFPNPEFESPRDYNGHGSHTGSTAAGNNNVTAIAFGSNLGQISGMAPAARLAFYKVLWHNAAAGNASGASVDLVAAINDAVADGVDVINYSISGSSQFVVDAVELAFLFAADAGVFVAASAGNNGPAVSTVAHNGPWVTTVAASTHTRSVTKEVTLGNGAKYTGIGTGPGVGSSPLIDSTAAGLPGADATAVRLCFSDADNNPTTLPPVPVLDPAIVAGKIVICERGANARIDKSLAVANAGGVGMIQYNPAVGMSFNADLHSVPSVHVDPDTGTALKTYAGTAGATASISEVLDIPIRAPQMAGFSSTGPAIAGGGDLLKPDITAPGVDILAAYAPPTRGQNFDVISGTSMSSPHIAGLAALLKSENPNWSPMWIKSALMTTAVDTDNTGGHIQRVGDATPFDYGNGHVVPKSSFRPGLIYDSDIDGWFQYACAIGQLQLIGGGATCASLPAIDPSDFNGPSIAGAQTVTRTVTNISKLQWIYRPEVSVPGFDVKVSPKLLFIPPGHSKSFTVTMTRTTAPIGAYAFGRLTWIPIPNLGVSVSSSIAVRPVPLAVPAQSVNFGTSGSITASPGYTGTLNTSTIGLVPATVTSFDLDTAGPNFSSAAPAAGPQVGLATVTIPAGTPLARFATFDADFPGVTDVDIWVYRLNTTGPPRTLVASSAGATAEETVTLTNPLAATYEIYVDLFAVGGDGTETVPFHSWVVPNSPAGNLTVSPASTPVTTGVPVTFNLMTSGLAADTRYLGRIDFSDGTSTLGSTIVRFDT
jgi:subtilisin family serine protease